MKSKAWTLLGLIFIVIFALSAIHMVYSVGVVNTISVGTKPSGVAYDSGKGEIFVANSGSNAVSVISDQGAYPTPTPTSTPVPTATPTPTKIPEFPSLGILALFMIVTAVITLALAIRKRKRAALSRY